MAFVVVARCAADAPGRFEVLMQSRIASGEAWWGLPGRRIDPHADTSSSADAPPPVPNSSLVQAADEQFGSKQIPREAKMKTRLPPNGLPLVGRKCLRFPGRIVEQLLIEENEEQVVYVAENGLGKHRYVPVLLAYEVANKWTPRARRRFRHTIDETVGVFGYKWFSLREICRTALHGPKPLGDGQSIAPLARAFFVAQRQERGRDGRIRPWLEYQFGAQRDCLPGAVPSSAHCVPTNRKKARRSRWDERPGTLHGSSEQVAVAPPRPAQAKVGIGGSADQNDGELQSGSSISRPRHVRRRIKSPDHIKLTRPAQLEVRCVAV